MNFDTDIQNPCVSCGNSHARRDGRCATCLDAREHPYTCHTCHGAGVLPMIRVGLRVARPERACPKCDGRGRVTQDEAVTELASYAIAVCRTLDTRLVPPQLIARPVDTAAFERARRQQEADVALVDSLIDEWRRSLEKVQDTDQLAERVRVGIAQRIDAAKIIETALREREVVS